MVFQQNKKAGERHGIGVSFLVYYDTGGSSCFIGIGVENPEKISFQIFCTHPCAFGGALYCCVSYV